MTRRELRRALVALLILAPLALLLWARIPLCPTAAVLGIPCPGCGLTRATLALLHGDFRGALRFHPLVFLITPLYGYVVLTALLSYVRPTPPAHAPKLRPWILSRTTTLAGLALFGLVLGVWGARFLGYFGGPVPVETWRDWIAEHRAPNAAR